MKREERVPNTTGFCFRELETEGVSLVDRMFPRWLAGYKSTEALGAVCQVCHSAVAVFKAGCPDQYINCSTPEPAQPLWRDETGGEKKCCCFMHTILSQKH